MGEGWGNGGVLLARQGVCREDAYERVTDTRVGNRCVGHAMYSFSEGGASGILFV